MPLDGKTLAHVHDLEKWKRGIRPEDLPGTPLGGCSREIGGSYEERSGERVTSDPQSCESVTTIQPSPIEQSAFRYSLSTVSLFSDDIVNERVY